MDDKVVGLKGDPVVPPGAPDAAIAEMLADLTARNARGELVALFCVFINTNDDAAGNWQGERPYNRATAIGALESLKIRFWSKTEDSTASVSFEPAS